MSLMITSISVTVNMTDAVLTQATNTLQSEIIFHCNAILTDIIEPSSIDIDVKWFVDNKNVHSETFSAQDRVSGVLTEEHWVMGQSIYCEAQAKHNIVWRTRCMVIIRESLSHRMLENTLARSSAPLPRM